MSQFPQCVNDMSFWLPDETFNPSDFYEIVRSVGGDIVEQVSRSLPLQVDTAGGVHFHRLTHFYFFIFLFFCGQGPSGR